MSNTNTSYLYPEFWASAFDEMDKGQYQLQQLVSRDTEALLAEYGQSVVVPITPEMSAGDWVPGANITATGVTQTKATVTLDQSKKVTINLTNAELSKSKYNLIESYGIPMAQAILEAVNNSIYLEMLKSGYFVDPGTPGTTAIDEDDVIDAGAKLSANKVSRANRVLVASPDDIANLLKTDAFQRADAAGDGGKAMTTGELGSKFGFKIFENNVIADYTPSDLAGAVNNVAGYLAGVTTIAVDAFNDATTPIRAGDVFTIADTTGTYTVISTTQDTDGKTTGLTFYPGLAGAASNDKVVTIIPTRSALAFVPSGLALAARAYSIIPAGVMSNVFDLGGIPVRLSVWHDGHLGLNVQSDILYGVKLINSKRIVRILC